MMGGGVARVSGPVNNKFIIVSHMLMNLNIPSISINTVDQSIGIAIDRNDEFNLARIQQILKNVTTGHDIHVSKTLLKSSSSITYCMKFNNI